MRNLLLSSAAFIGIGGVKPAASVKPARVEPVATTKPAAASKPASKKKDGESGDDPDADGDDDEDGDNEDADRDGDDEDGDEDSDTEEMKRGRKARAARMRERARIAAILGDPSAAANVDFAAHLALNTELGRDAACALLAAAPSGRRTGLSARMEGQAGRFVPPASPDPTAASERARVADGWSKAFAAASPFKQAS